jgi:hypothetical protein
MTESLLLSYVLPIDSIPDFRGLSEYDTPLYNKETYSDNLKDYQIYNVITAKIRFEDELASRNPGTAIAKIILDLMYHPLFPEVFFNYVSSTIDDLPVLLPENVESFMNGNYSGLLKPDCDYLTKILTLWSSSYTVFYHSNVKSVLSWLYEKAAQLPDWPFTVATDENNNRDIIQLTASAEATTAKFQVTKAVIRTTKRTPSEQGLLPSEIRILTDVLRFFELLDENDKIIYSTRPGILAGVIGALSVKQKITSNKTAAYRTLVSDFNYQRGKRVIQGIKHPSEETITFYDRTLHFIKDNL